MKLTHKGIGKQIYHNYICDMLRFYLFIVIILRQRAVTFTIYRVSADMIVSIRKSNNTVNGHNYSPLL